MMPSIALRFVTGSEPGMPRQTGQTWVLGSAPNSVEHPQNIFVVVPSSMWVSMPSTGSYFASASSYGTSVVVSAMLVSQPLQCLNHLVPPLSEGGNPAQNIDLDGRTDTDHIVTDAMLTGRLPAGDLPDDRLELLLRPENGVDLLRPESGSRKLANAKRRPDR